MAQAAAALFTNVDNNGVGREMSSWVFYKGITNGYIKIKEATVPMPKPVFDASKPEDKTVSAGETVNLTASFSNYDENTAAEWYYKAPGGSWTLCTSPTYTYYNAVSYGYAGLGFTADASMNGYQFYCQATNAGGSAQSRAAILTVREATAPVFDTTTPEDRTVSAGETVNLTAHFSIPDSNITIEWYYRAPGENWTKCTSPTYTYYNAVSYGSAGLGFTAQSSMNGYQFYCKAINGGTAGYSTSRTVTLTVMSYISNVAVTIPAPTAGARPDYSPVLPSGAGYFSDTSFSSSSSLNDVAWFDETAERWLDTTDTFAAGHVYSVRIDLTPKSGYEFDADCTGTINGKTADAYLRNSEEYDYLRLSYTFPAVTAGGWKKDSNGWWYQRADGTYPKNQWEKIGGKWYHFDAYGYMQTGWLKLGGTWYYLDSSGAMATGWQHIGGQWYYFNSSGAMLTGWQTIGGQKYYFNTSGAMQKGWQHIGGKWYYFNSSGAMQTGWQTIGGQKYYLSADGSMVTGLQKVDGKWYYFESSGVLSTAAGWRKIGTKWYYFDSNGAAQTGWQHIGGKWYYFESTGVMATGWKLLSGKWYYLGTDGAMATGWRLIDNVWYYFETSGVMLANTTKTINGKSYTFNTSGVCTNP